MKERPYAGTEPDAEFYKLMADSVKDYAMDIIDVSRITRGTFSEAGIDMHLVKPVEPEVLLAILNTPRLSDSTVPCNCIEGEQ